MQEKGKISTFSFEVFLEDLKGDTTSKIALEIIEHLKSGKLKVLINSSVAISQVSSYEDKNVVLFLPENYSFESAAIEYVRILPEILRHSSDSRSMDMEKIDEIEKKIKIESQLQSK